MADTESPQNLYENWLDKVEKIAAAVAAEHACFIYDLEFVSGRILRVYIDKEGGAGIEDCTNVTRGLNLHLDAEDIVPGGNYNLEVSTPGIERHLKKLWHFEKVVGQKIALKSKVAFEKFGIDIPQFMKSKNVEGVLKIIENGNLTLEVSGHDLIIPFGEVEKSNVVFELKKQEKKSRG